MATLPIKQPRRIDPALIEIGDDVIVEHKKDRGITTTIRGIVGKRVDSGDTRYLMTAEGATILAWSPARRTPIKVTLCGREEFPQESLFDTDQMEMLKERIGA